MSSVVQTAFGPVTVYEAAPEPRGWAIAARRTADELDAAATMLRATAEQVTAMADTLRDQAASPLLCDHELCRANWAQASLAKTLRMACEAAQENMRDTRAMLEVE